MMNEEPSALHGTRDNGLKIEGNEKWDEFANFIVSWKNPDGEEEEGPLGFLWQLIESYRVDIFDVSLNRITNDFIEFLKRSRELNLELASSFTVMSSRLLFYKSRALLPDPGLDTEEEEQRLPPELIDQLLEYRKYQMAAEKMRQRENIALGMLSRNVDGASEIAQNEKQTLKVNLIDLIRAYSGIMERLKQTQEENDDIEIVMDEFSVEDQITRIRSHFENSVSFSFQTLFNNLENMNKGEVIATFLALLELANLGEIIIRQSLLFGELKIVKRSAVVN